MIGIFLAYAYVCMFVVIGIMVYYENKIAKNQKQTCNTLGYLYWKENRMIQDIEELNKLVKLGAKLLSERRKPSLLENSVIKQQALRIEELRQRCKEIHSPIRPLKVVVDVAKNKQIYIKVIYKSNSQVFLTSETYVNKNFAIKKAKELASYFGTPVEYKIKKSKVVKRPTNNKNDIVVGR